MVKTVFDTVVNNTFPWGRGVLPNYEVKLTLEELAYENGDTILNYTKTLISENKYIIEQEETSSETVSETTNKTKQAIAVATLLLVVVLIVIFKTRRGKK